LPVYLHYQLTKAINAANFKEMTTTAAEIKVGQVIKFANLWGEVTASPKQSDYAANEVDILVSVPVTKIRRREGVQTIPAHNTTFSYRKMTKVQTK